MSYKCRICGGRINIAKEVFGTIMCPACYQENLIKCNSCQKMFPAFLGIQSFKGIHCPECQGDKDSIICCKDCGKIMEKSLSTKVSNGNLCPSCINRQYKKCAVCAKLTKCVSNVTDSLEGAESFKGKMCCSNSCYDKFFKENLSYRTCYHDSLQYKESDLTKLLNVSLCKYCLDHYTYLCKECGIRLYRNDSLKITINGLEERICEKCYTKKYFQCTFCNGHFLKDESVIFEGNSECCVGCWKARIIHHYQYKPNPIFYKNVYEESTYLGLEIEVTSKKERNNILAISLVEKFPELFESRFYIKFDRSTGNGFEIVSHPMTYGYIRKNIRFKELLDWLVKEVYEDGNGNCGFHIHIDKRQYKERTNNKIFLDKLVIFFYSNFDRIVKFSRRNRDQINEWCMPFSKEDCWAIIKRTGEFDRHRVLNIRLRDTVEIRIFNGDINYPIVMKYIRFTSILISFLKFYDRILFENEFKDKVKGALWKMFVKYAEGKNQHLYKELINI